MRTVPCMIDGVVHEPTLPVSFVRSESGVGWATLLPWVALACTGPDWRDEGIGQQPLHKPCAVRCIMGAAIEGTTGSRFISLQEGICLTWEQEWLATISRR